MGKFNGMSMDIEKSERDKMKRLFPQCFNEGKIDMGKLLNLCGEYIDEDFEKYKFEWKGKAECHRIARKHSTGTLRPRVEVVLSAKDIEKLMNITNKGTSFYKVFPPNIAYQLIQNTNFTTHRNMEAG